MFLRLEVCNEAFTILLHSAHIFSRSPERRSIKGILAWQNTTYHFSIHYIPYASNCHHCVDKSPSIEYFVGKPLSINYVEHTNKQYLLVYVTNGKGTQ